MKNNIDIEHINKTTILCLRNQRNQMLKETDKYLIIDYPITSENLILMKEYRQNLRDFMNLDEVVNYNFSVNINIPEIPKPPF
jgi:hypothetical protein